MYLTEGIYRFRLCSHGCGRGRWCAGSLVASSLVGSWSFLLVLINIIKWCFFDQSSGCCRQRLFKADFFTLDKGLKQTTQIIPASPPRKGENS